MYYSFTNVFESFGYVLEEKTILLGKKLKAVKYIIANIFDKLIMTHIDLHETVLLLAGEIISHHKVLY